MKKHPEREGGFSGTRKTALSWMCRSCLSSSRNVTVLKSWSNLCFETEQLFGFRIGSGINKYVTETSESISLESVEYRVTGKSVAKARPRLKPAVTWSLNFYSFPWKKMDRHQSWRDFVKIVLQCQKPWSDDCDMIHQDTVLLPEDFTEYIYHIGNVSEMHSIIRSGLILEGRSLKRGIDNPCFSQQWNRWTTIKYGRNSLRLGQAMDRTIQKYLETSSIHSVLVQFKTRSEERNCNFIKHDHTIVLFNTLPAICIETAVCMKTKEE